MIAHTVDNKRPHTLSSWAMNDHNMLLDCYWTHSSQWEKQIKCSSAQNECCLQYSRCEEAWNQTKNIIIFEKNEHTHMYVVDIIVLQEGLQPS